MSSVLGLFLCVVAALYFLRGRQCIANVRVAMIQQIEGKMFQNHRCGCACWDELWMLSGTKDTQALQVFGWYFYKYIFMTIIFCP